MAGRGDNIAAISSGVVPSTITPSYFDGNQGSGSQVHGMILHVWVTFGALRRLSFCRHKPLKHDGLYR